MKKLLLITFLAIYGTSVAQENEIKRVIPKDTWSIGGGLNIGSSRTENFQVNQDDNTYSKGFSFGFTPKIGYTIANDLTVGLGIGMDYAKSEENYNDEESTNKSLGYIINPFIRKNFGAGKNLSLFLQAEGRYSLYERKDSNSDSYEDPQKKIFIGLRPGLNYFLSNKIALEATIGSLGYNYSSYKYRIDSFITKRESNTFNFDLSTSNINLGVLILL
ncbi:outer membrane protein with beta-barrel domain [Cellulophaga sp. RHA19]|uniref:outer membrane beta-barrel protein n=1 Tax=Cellulophaga sp. RHA19 TaxID=1798237 RepID=UPI000C2B57C2|nr:outer membrane beta-barrel protein [Cellulophaga sp. RHA19]PKB42935.1 outer membrane protein with beta-barrel domain [Cellulophaga sp. RHA19]